MENFDKIYDRKAYNCIKWSRNPYGHPDFIPMGIADMDLATPDFVIDAIKARLAHPILGYFKPTDRLYQAVIKWQREQFGIRDIAREEIMLHVSVLGGVSSAIQTVTEAGDAVLVQAPGYFNFVQVLESLGRKVVSNGLLWDGEQYQLDFDAMEREIKEREVKALLLCSPQNPTGRVWTKEELMQIEGICRRHQVTVIADEIWADLVFDGQHTPFHSISDWAREHTITLYSPTKTFNMAGITIAYSLVREPELRAKFEKECGKSHYNFPNLLSAEAMTAAYENGGEWLKELRAYLKENTAMTAEFFHKEYPGVRVAVPQGTYLLWLDFSDMGLDSDQLLERFGKAGLYFNDGRSCIAQGDRCLRMNAAMPRPMLLEVLKRIRETL